jgi:putative oxidoreductase
MTKNYTDLGLLLLRVGFAGFMLTHGVPKISMISDPSVFADPLGVGKTLSLILALIGEVVAPIFLIVGYKTKWAAIPAFITMGVAAFVVHGKDDLGTKEMALIYFIAFLVMFLAGAGKYSLDGMRRR